ncbi:hypothetical protein CMQ_3599 [Grosmannia clavigera kw1407]|uniref:Uncharacterized protein n=1 Tax=Grosmannia clavigera (strain kw1407 / UAMH 11150) TaxID=655863 RepID=F0X8T6_GROCL|nr:uncharacterized protein CMQ_3599 [Grosmannia clavigera kw1407]EFX05530.1 hypothetical protein CMQ_3599 [Grosmannia clavigera kw1407]
MDAIKGLIANVPDWVKRLDELKGQIDQRQLELARVELELSPTSSPSRTKSIRNKGSTESLKPNNEAAAWGEDKGPIAGPHVDVDTGADADVKPRSPLAPHFKVPGDLTAVSALQHQTNQVMKVAQAKARATLRKRDRRSDSIASAEKGPSKYRTRSMIIVYYDSYVQSFFEELVKFVSASRNMMRKAKMAAKVAQIKRLADLEVPDVDDDKNAAAAQAAATGNGQDYIIKAAAPSAADESLLKLNYVSTRHMRGPGAATGGRPMFSRAGRSSLAGGPQAPDVYDELDKGLEFVQSTCEHAAHQFLRDGDCFDEIEKVKNRLATTKELADREMERIKKEDPDALKQSVEPPKSRSFRPQHMRKGLSVAKDALPSAATGAADATVAIEVDEGIEDMDEDSPKPAYKPSTPR